mgnify:CR=1 FL=1
MTKRKKYQRYMPMRIIQRLPKDVNLQKIENILRIMPKEKILKWFMIAIAALPKTKIEQLRFDLQKQKGILKKLDPVYGKKPRSAKQKAATKKLIAWNKANR